MPDRHLRLHLGAFDCGIDGWVNTDITAHLFIARVPFLARAMRVAGVLNAERFEKYRQGIFRRLRYVNLSKPLPFADASCEAVFSSHVFEHLFADEIGRLIAEIQRVLIPGGVCRVVVPDLEKIVSLFDVERPEAFLQDMFEVGERAAVKNAHHYGFTKASLTRIFREAAYSQTQICEFRQGDCPDVERLDNRPESIFFEAKK